MSVAIITEDVRAVVGVRHLVAQLASGADLIDERFLARIGKIKVRAPRRGSKRRRAVRVHGPRGWLVSVVPLDEDRYESENQLVEAEKAAAEKETEFSDSDTGYQRWHGNSPFRKEAKPGDLVIEIFLPHSRSKRGTVYAPEPLLRRRDKGNITHFFIEEYADRKATSMPFSQFRMLWTRVSTSRTPTVNSVREVPVELVETLRSLWT